MHIIESYSSVFDSYQTVSHGVDMAEFDVLSKGETMTAAAKYTLPQSSRRISVTNRTISKQASGAFKP
jgi:archaellum component FlaF (FlaF/FlaG flagellin family)